MSSRMFFFFSSRRRHTRCSRDWSSDVCSSDLADFDAVAAAGDQAAADVDARARGAAEPGDGGEPAARGSAHRGARSEERRVGKECRSRWSAEHYKKNKTEYRRMIGVREQLDVR